jgi:hypothetical protein
MARAEVEFSRESVLPVLRNRLTGETGSLQRPQKARPDIIGRRTASYTVFPSQNLDHPQEFPFPEVSDNSYSPVDRRKRGSTASSLAQDTPVEQPWNSEPQVTSGADLDNLEGLDYRSHKTKYGKPKVHIKPILRKMSRDDAPSTSIDLNRSSTEQEGLGIYMNLERERGHSGPLTGTTYKMTPSGLHNRSTSGTSQFSTGSGSSGGKPGSQYVHPMRQTPRAYTPPLGQSYQESNDSEELDETPDPESSDLQESYASSIHAPPRLSLQIQDDSFTRLPSISQTNVTSRPSFGYSRDLDGTTSPMSRTSLDFVFRSRTRTSTDPISRAATVQAAREAFEEKEAAKIRRLEKQQIKAEERGSRRRLKRHTSEGPESPVVQSSEDISEKPQRSTVHGSEQPSASWKSQSKSTWVLFMTWLRTRIFKLKRKIRKQ